MSTSTLMSYIRIAASKVTERWGTVRRRIHKYFEVEEISAKILSALETSEKNRTHKPLIKSIFLTFFL